MFAQTEELAQRLTRAEQKLGEHRRGQEAALHGLDEERHVRELRQEQFAARLDSIASAMEGTRKQVSRAKCEKSTTFTNTYSFDHSTIWIVPFLHAF